MKENIIYIVWVVVSLTIITTTILREPNVESAGAIIQESQYGKDKDSEKKIDKLILFLFLIFIISTVFLFLKIQ